ncbi:glycoside hydrolase family 11 protein [Hyaloscypha variabilis]|uniref:Endo-1,4-beta-xylanase n=1 Tax=Hyaloscypha variabilis (strain UAMH 11265 / GT02V1 / F) TaxID=1149755 RepID=A0A2J6S7N7_HYAVF|nr:glycoside hydrolase family 11 protein [Hyaloscypha variabilis F]
MRFLNFLIFALCAGVGVCALPGEVLDRGAGAAFYSSDWDDGTAKHTYTNGPNGLYSVVWSGDKGNFVSGKGYNPGGPRAVDYSGSFEPIGNAYLSLYGWTTNPLVEYYIVDSYGTHKPCSSLSDNATMLGNVTSDGEVYEIWTKKRINEPSIQGKATFNQAFSIRTTKRVGGTITTGNHYAAWKKVGLKLGGYQYMIIATEGQNSTGKATITVGVAPKDVATA